MTNEPTGPELTYLVFTKILGWRRPTLKDMAPEFKMALATTERKYFELNNRAMPRKLKRMNLLAFVENKQCYWVSDNKDCPHRWALRLPKLHESLDLCWFWVKPEVEKAGWNWGDFVACNIQGTLEKTCESVLKASLKASGVL